MPLHYFFMTPLLAIWVLHVINYSSFNFFKSLFWSCPGDDTHGRQGREAERMPLKGSLERPKAAGVERDLDFCLLAERQRGKLFVGSICNSACSLTQCFCLQMGPDPVKTANPKPVSKKCCNRSMYFEWLQVPDWLSWPTRRLSVSCPCLLSGLFSSSPCSWCWDLTAR